MTQQFQQLPRVLRGAALRADGTIEGVNLSQLIDEARCGYRWHLRYRRGIDRRTIAGAMDLGSAVHAGIHGGILLWSTFRTPRITSKRLKLVGFSAAKAVVDWAEEWAKGRGKLTEETQQELSDTILKASQIARRALEEMNLSKWLVCRLPDGRPMVEQKILWPIPGVPGIPFYGTPDVVANDLEEGGNWVWDYKVRERFVSPEDEQFDVQLPGYQHGLKQQQPPIQTVGAIKFQILSRLPSQPSLNKNGTMSRQRIATTWEVYRQALLDAKLDPADYEQEMIPKLDVKFFSLERYYRNDFMVQRIWDEVTVPMAKRFLRRKTFHRFMHTWGCNGCWARSFCLAELRAEDTDFLLQTEYIDTTKPAEALTLRPEDFNFRED